jgi:hypothetical protein
MSKTLRYLRIAWSVACGVACLLLITLWVRSYWRADSFHYAGIQSVGISINPGLISFGRSETDPTLLGPLAYQWRHFSRTNPEVPTRSFGWLWTDTDFVIEFPIWLSVVICALVSTLSWIPWHFSLRTLLIAMTIIAVGLGLIVLL